MSLNTLERKFAHRLDRIDSCTADFSTNHFNPARCDPEAWKYLEGLLSSLWQYWGHFCRCLIIESSLGCQTASGAVLASVVVPPIWERVSYLSAQSKQKCPKYLPGVTNSILRFEPTWGDVNSLSKVVSAIKPGNQAQLLAAFGSAQKVIHLQKVRNAAAHRNTETMTEVMKFSPLYNLQEAPRHPVEAAFWIDPTSNLFAIESWTDEMRVIANLAVQ